MAEDAQRSLATIAAFAQAMLRHHTLDDLLWDIADLIGELLGFDDCVIYMVEGEVLVQAAAFGLKNPTKRQIKEPIVIPIGRGIVGSVALTAEAEYVADISSDERYIADQYAGRSELTVPVVFDDEVIGVFDSESDVPDGFSELDRMHFQLVADIASSRIAWLRSERSRLAAIKRQDAARLEALGLLAGGIAHDFNNLLSIVLASSEISEMARNSLERETSHLALRAAVARASGLTKRLGTFAKGGAPVRELIDPVALLEPMVDMIGASIRCQLKVRGALPLLNADATLLSQVLQNLLVNASEVTPPGGTVSVLAERCAFEGGVGLRIEVADQGPGIPDETLTQIFDPYFSTKSRGSGLGLATAYWSVVRHGGTIEVVSSNDAGTVFRVTLPALEGTLPGLSEKPGSKRPKTLKILVLEDEDLLRRVLYNLLGRAGHEVLVIEDGAEAVAIWQAASEGGQPFDLALLDLHNAGGMGGVLAFQALRETDPTCRAVSMSGYSEDEGLLEYKRLGFRGRLEKPFDLITLSAVLADAMTDG